MRRKGRLLHSSILTAALFVFAAPGFAAEPAPGDVCANLNYIISTGGPETLGIHRLLRCDGTNWQLMMTIDASGHVGIGNPTPSAALDVLSSDTVGDIFPAIFGGSTTEGVTLVVNNWEPNHHQAQIVFQDQWYVGNSLGANTTDDFYIYNRATSSSPFGISPGNSVNVNAAIALTGDISPAQITANQNDYNPAGLSSASVLRLNSNASRNITSLAGGADGRVVTLMNVGSFPIVLKNDDGATGTAANRFALTGDLTLAAKQSAMLMYDSTASRWRQIANGTATGSGDNLGNHIATANIQLGSNWLSGDGGNEGITVDASGKVGIGVVPSFDLDIAVADKSGFLQLANTSSTADRYPTISVTNYSGATNGVPTFAMYRARGNSGTPAAVQQWDLLGAIEFQGHDGASSRNSAAKIEGWASENWSNTAHGSSLDFATTPNGSTTKAVRLTIANDGMVSIANAVALTGDITPAQITVNQNDYNPAGLSTASVLRLSSDATRNITGIAGGVDGRVLTIFNVGTNYIVFKNQSTSSSAASRIALGGDLILAADQSISLIYDATSQRWRSASLPFEVTNGCVGPSDCPSIGNVCTDGTVFFGCNPRSGAALFTTRCDAGQTWSGSSCTGTRTQQYWANSSSSSSLRTTGVVSTYDGQGNTTALTNGVIDGTGDARTTSGLQTHNAAQYCADLSSNGYTDWYLPAEAELFVMAMNRDVIGSSTFVDANWYWSSTEEYSGNTDVLVVLFQNDASRGLYADGMLSKYELSYLRCIRQ